MTIVTSQQQLVVFDGVCTFSGTFVNHNRVPGETIIDFQTKNKKSAHSMRA